MKKYVNIVIIFLLSLFLVNAYIHKEIETPKVQKGQINLQQWDFNRGIVKLDGQWEVYYGKLLSPSDFISNKKISGAKYIKIPGVFNSEENSFRNYKYGTIRLRIKLKSNISNKIQYGISTEYMLSASKIWVNGKLLSSVGNVSKNATSSRESYERQMIFFGAPSNNIDLVIQMSNFHNIEGKIRRLFLGTYKQIKQDYIKGVSLDAFVIGCLIMMGIYHILIFYKRREFKAPLYFGMFCIAIAIRNALVSQRLVYEIFPNIPFSIFNKIAYLTVYFAFPFILMFFREMFTEKFSYRLTKVVNLVSILICIPTIFFGLEWYDRLLIFYEIIIIISFIYVMVIIIQQIIKKDNRALTIFMGFVVVLITVINDIFRQAGFINSTSLTPIGIAIFVFIQSYMLASEFSKAYKHIEKLVEENKAVFIDELTGLLNRRAFYDYGSKLFEKVKSTNSTFLIFYLDLNKFKSINDTFGHKEGDIAIINTANIIKESFEASDIVSRLSGDEFIVITANRSIHDAKEIYLKIKRGFDYYNNCSFKPYKLSISIGYAAYDGNSKLTLDEIIHQADEMLYEEKEQSRGRY